MKKSLITFTLLVVSTFSFGDNENFNGQNVSNYDFSRWSHAYSSWVSTIARGTIFSSYAYFTNYEDSVFISADLTSARFEAAILNRSDFTNANLTSAGLYIATLCKTDFTNANLTSAGFDSATLTGADFTSANLTSVCFEAAILSEADFTNAIINKAYFKAAEGFTEEQLYSTYNYNYEKNLSEVNFDQLNMTSWNFTKQNLTSASFGVTTLNGANFTSANLTSANFDTARLSEADFTDADLTSANFSAAKLSGADLTNANFKLAILSGANIENADISNANFLNAEGFTKEQLYSTKSYNDKNLSGVGFSGLNMTSWNFSQQNLQNSDFTTANITDVIFDSADLRGADIAGVLGEYASNKNAIWTDGTIQNFSMTSSSDNFSIRKYTPATEGGAIISAKFAEDASISGGAMLTLEIGAKVEVIDDAALSFGTDSSLIINTDKEGSTKLTLVSGGLTIENGAIFTVNIIDDFGTQNYDFTLIEWNESIVISGIENLVKGISLVLKLNGEDFVGNWDFSTDNNALKIMAGVPEPATIALILGVFVLGFAVWRKRK